MRSKPDSSHLSVLGKWLAGLRYEDIPESALRAARYQILNMLAAVYASAKMPETIAVHKAARAMAPGKEGKCTVFGLTGEASAEKLPPVEAAIVNCAYAMAQDFDDIIWMGHTCHSAVFASLAVAEHEAKSFKELLTAVVASNEIAGRLGATSFFGPLNGQMTTYIHHVGGAAAGAKLLGLNAEQATNALAISLAQPNFALQPGFMVPTSKLLAAATPTATGIQAAYFAREGMTGDSRILEDKRGFWRRFSFIELPFMLEELGKFWAIETLTMKTFPGCHFFQTACSALEKILEARQGRAQIDEVEAVELATTKFGFEVTHFAADYAEAEGPVGAVNLNFDLATTAAVFLHAGRLTGDEVDSDWLADNSGAIQDWKKKISVSHDLLLTQKVILSAQALPTGRRALSMIGMGDLLHLSRSYRREYQSSLFKGTKPTQLFSALGRIARASAKKVFSSRRDEPAFCSSVPLYFPNRATVRFRDGTVLTEQVDLPVAAFCAPGVETELRKKFISARGNPRIFDLVLKETPARISGITN